MAANFPGTPYTRTDLVDGAGNDYPQAAHVNTPANEVVAIAAHLGGGSDVTSNGGILKTLARGGTDVGYSGEVAANDVAGVAVTVIPNGSTDVTAGISFIGVIKPSSGTTTGGPGFCANNASVELFTDGTDVCTLTVNADGSVEVQRTSGSTLTFDVVLSAVWI